MIVGVVLSIPLVIFGARLISAVVARFSLLVWTGAALLGYVAGDLAVSDPLIAAHTAGLPHGLPGAVVCAIVVLLCLALTQLADDEMSDEF